MNTVCQEHRGTTARSGKKTVSMHPLLRFFSKIIFPLPPLASREGGQIDFVMYLVHGLILVLFVGWAIYFIYVLWRFRQPKNPKASYQGLSNKLSLGVEIAVALAEIILLMGISIPFWKNYMVDVPTGKNVLHLQVVAQQFAWDVLYPGPNGKFAHRAQQFYDAQNNPLGLDPHDPQVRNNFVRINLMHLPVGVPVVIDLTSMDVIHSFTLPEMRVKRDIIPGMRVQAWFTPIKEGTFDIACSQLCGIGHYRMKGVLIVESLQKYQEWVKSNTLTYSANLG